MAIALAAIGLIAGLGLTAVQTPMFLLFIIEEAVQAVGFGSFVMLKEEDPAALRAHNEKYKQTVQILEEWTTVVKQYFSFFSIAAFEDLGTIQGVIKNLLRILPGDKSIADLDDIVNRGTAETVDLSFLVEPYEVFAAAAKNYAAAIDLKIEKMERGIVGVAPSSPVIPAGKAQLTIDDSFGRSAIFIDGVYIRHLTPEVVTLEPGRHTISIKKRKENLDVTTTIEVQAGQDVSLFYDGVQKDWQTSATTIEPQPPQTPSAKLPLISDVPTPDAEAGDPLPPSPPSPVTPPINDIRTGVQFRFIPELVKVDGDHFDVEFSGQKTRRQFGRWFKFGNVPEGSTQLGKVTYSSNGKTKSFQFAVAVPELIQYSITFDDRGPRRIVTDHPSGTKLERK